jgi:hypothetical protein
LASGVELETVAVLVAVPAVTALTTIVAVAEPPLASVPRLQDTVEVPEHVPAVVDADTKLTSAGNGSLTVAATAESGPAFAALIVYVI